MISNIGLFGGKTVSKRLKPKSTPKKKHILAKPQLQTNKNLVKNCWEISMEQLVTVKKSKSNIKQTKSVQKYVSIEEEMFGKLVSNNQKKESKKMTVAGGKGVVASPCL